MSSAVGGLRKAKLLRLDKVGVGLFRFALAFVGSAALVVQLARFRVELDSLGEIGN